jgi:hypothetical protein
VMSYTFYNCSVSENEIPDANEISLRPVPANDVLVIRQNKFNVNTPFEFMMYKVALCRQELLPEHLQKFR